MARLALQRLLALLPLWCAVTLLTFALVRVVPGDPVAILLGPQAVPTRVAALRQALGLDDPLPVQYGRYLLGLLQGDLGHSFQGGTSVRDALAARLPATLELVLVALGFALVGLPAGIAAAWQRGGWLDQVVSALAALALALPVFWLAPLAIVLFGVHLRWVSVSGDHLLLPALLLALGPAGLLARVARAGVIEVLRQEYVRTARAKGLSEAAVLWRHVLPNALIPVVSMLGVLASNLLTGTVFLEMLFGRPGLGVLALEAVQARDLPQVQGVVLVSATFFLGLNLLADLLMLRLDPRQRAG